MCSMDCDSGLPSGRSGYGEATEGDAMCDSGDLAGLVGDRILVDRVLVARRRADQRCASPAHDIAKPDDCITDRLRPMSIDRAEDSLRKRQAQGVWSRIISC